MTNTPAMNQKIATLDYKLDNVKNNFQSRFEKTHQNLKTNRSKLSSATNFTVNILYNFYNESLKGIKDLEDIVKDIKAQQAQQKSLKTKRVNNSLEPDLNSARTTHISELRIIKENINEQIKKHNEYLSEFEKDILNNPNVIQNSVLPSMIKNIIKNLN